MSRFVTLLYCPLFPLIALILFVFLFVLYLSTFLPRKYTDKHFRPLARYWCRLFVRSLLVNLRLEFAEDAEIPEQYILVANHPSLLEDFGIPAFFDIRPLAKSGVRDWFFLGRISEYGGTVFVKRDDRDSRKNALSSMLDAVHNGGNLVIFPEGGCHGKDIQPTFRTGAFEISMKTGVPILPVFLFYQDEDAFEWADQGIFHKLLQILFAGDKCARYIVQKPVSASDYEDKFVYAEDVRCRFVSWQNQYRKSIWN